MLDDQSVLRIVVVVSFLAVSLSIAWVARRGIAFVRHPFDASGMEPGVTIYTSATCDACARARSSLDELDVDFDEVVYEARPEEFERLGITGVPSIVIVAPDGRGWIVRGHPARSRLARWVQPASGGP